MMGEGGPRRRRVAGFALLATVLLVTLLPGNASAATHDVSIVDFIYQPATLNIAPGDTVVWTNNDPEGHTVTADNGSFDSGILQPEADFSVDFPTAGEFPYFCEIHPGQEGTIVVQGNGVTTTTMAPTTTTMAPTTTTMAPTTTTMAPTTTTMAPTTSTSMAPTTTTMAPTTSTSMAPTTTTMAPTTSTSMAPTTTTMAPTTTTSPAPTTTTMAPTTTTSMAPTTTTMAPTTTTSMAPTTTTSPAPTTTTTPPPDGPIQITPDARGNGNVLRITGTIACDVGNRFRIELHVGQGETHAQGVRTGQCRGGPQRFTAIVTVTSGPFFTSGPAQVDATAQIGNPGSRTIEDTFGTSADIDIAVRSGLLWAT